MHHIHYQDGQVTHRGPPHQAPEVAATENKLKKCKGRETADLKDSLPGVSIIRSPGNFISDFEN